MPTTQREKITFLLLNYLALEGAQTHFDKLLPADNKNIRLLYNDICKLSPPATWDHDQGIYDYTRARPTTGESDAQKCWHYLKAIRNNLFHANKAKQPDTPDRLNDLLDWSLKFISELNKEEHDIGQQAKKIRETLQIN